MSRVVTAVKWGQRQGEHEAREREWEDQKEKQPDVVTAVMTIYPATPRGPGRSYRFTACARRVRVLLNSRLLLLIKERSSAGVPRTRENNEHAPQPSCIN